MSKDSLPCTGVCKKASPCQLVLPGRCQQDDRGMGSVTYCIVKSTLPALLVPVFVIIGGHLACTVLSRVRCRTM